MKILPVLVGVDIPQNDDACEDAVPTVLRFVLALGQQTVGTLPVHHHQR